MIEDTNKSLKEIYTNKQEINKTVQELNVKIESVKKKQTKGNLEMKMLETQAGTSEASLTYRTQEVKERISGTESMIKEMDTSVKENVKSKILLAQNIQEIWNTMDRPNLRIIGI
jgi:predicted  nucleic acid-binding Zn-ribbon protein